MKILFYGKQGQKLCLFINKCARKNLANIL